MKFIIAALVIVVAGIVPTVRAQKSAAQPPRPNILFILADDYGIDGIGCYGSDRFKDKTPHIDALAKDGIRFDRCYATPVCGPSRCQLITGRYGFRTGGLSNTSCTQVKAAEEASVARVLKQSGYATGMAGKWRQVGGMPHEWGFDEYLMSDIAGSPSVIKGYLENGQHVEKPEGAYYPDIQQAFALKFLREHRDQPFFFYYASHLVHDPNVATPDTKPGETRKNVLYDDNVAYLDKQVGELVAEVDKLGIRQRTLILFSGDNGTDAGDGPIAGRKPGRASTIGGRKLWGGKRDMTEGGAGVPLIASWKATAPAGRVVRDLVSFTDLLPTLAELGDAPLPQGVTLDGHSFAPQLRGEKGTPRTWVYTQLDARWFVRDDGWKLNQQGELFDMSDAPYAEKPVPADTTDAVALAARQRLAAVLAQLNPAGGKTEPTPKKAE